MNSPAVGSLNVWGLELLIFFLSHFMDDRASSQAVCPRPLYHDWQTQPRNITLRWTLAENTCNSVNQCWNGMFQRDQHQQHWTNQSYAFHQLCPLEVQMGDALFATPDRTLERYGVDLVKVSKEEFERCSLEQVQSKHFLTGLMKGRMQVDPKWLPPGFHYFAATHKGSSQLCQLGLRVGVVVKEQHCQDSPLLRLCSGHGVCRAKVRQLVYGCQCNEHYSGHFCEDFDACSEQPCLKGATCVSHASAKPNQPSYECLCPSRFTGESIVFLC